MVRPRIKELTHRELEIMHAFWRGGEQTAAQARDALATSGRRLAYTTVATLVRILVDKGYLRQTNTKRPFTFVPARSFNDVAQRILGDLVTRVFHGSRAALLLQLMEDDELTDEERAILARRSKEKQS
jgi:predicted transcriptional regulator